MDGAVSATPLPSAHARRLGNARGGAMPGGPMTAKVLTDTLCTGRADGSRCRNDAAADGSRIVLRHPHDMSEVPCLAPGEDVLLVPTRA
jgi:hypothetical protein